VPLLPFGPASPDVDADAWVAPTALLIGRVRLGPRSSVWYGAVLRADGDEIRVGTGSNVQDNCVLHADPGFPVSVGDGVVIGHGAVVHGCTVEDGVLVGMGSTVLNGVRIGAGSLIAAGAVLLEGTVVPPGSMVAGVPAKVRRPLTEDEAAGIGVAAEQTSLPSGLTATPFGALSARATVQPDAVGLRHPAAPAAWVSAPVVVLRWKTERLLLKRAATKTCVLSGLTATATAPCSALPSTQAPALPSSLTQADVPDSWVRTPVLVLREKAATAWLVKDDVT
jgi:carbonic anhydrase/acetyltransferase-like protein (isoleucine patch superfamily)